MNKGKGLYAAMVWLALSFSGALQAGFACIEFSAEMVQLNPGGETVSGRVFVGKRHMRTELRQGGDTIALIADSESGSNLLLNLEQRTYLLQQGRPNVDVKSGRGERNPCEEVEGALCERLGEEQLNGRPASKWQITLGSGEGAQKVTQWLDKQRGFPLRTLSEGGQQAEMRLLGRETLAGRSVEKWQVSVNRPEQEVVRTTQWYDPALCLAIKEIFPGGRVRELKQIELGEQSPALFVVPEGFKQVELPR